MNPLRVVWYGIYDPAYPRNDILLRGLRAAGAEVIEIHADWKDPARHRRLRDGLRALRDDYDLVYAAYPATMPAIWAKSITRKPVVMDALYSMHDAVVHDRQEVPWYHPRALQLWLLDWVSALLADYLIVDTLQHAAYWARFPFVRRAKMQVIYTGVQDHIFFPDLSPRTHDDFLVSFHGFYIPLQGVDKIAEAAALLAGHSEIRIRLIGSGQLSKKVDAVIEKHSLKNLEQTGRLPAAEVAARSKEADVVLGVFGDTEKARRVIPNKVYEGLALKKPVITMDAPSVREIFSENELMLIDNTPQAIADAILTLAADPARAARLAETGYQTVVQHYSPKPLGKELYQFLCKVTGRAVDSL
ncbi:MAG TPA: glycosyltransferase [Candidatus Paceibacterota bacterium]|nr:glycosyltransferase [Candidatus Paceibacterota bacterium]